VRSSAATLLLDVYLHRVKVESSERARARVVFEMRKVVQMATGVGEAKVEAALETAKVAKVRGEMSLAEQMMATGLPRISQQAIEALGIDVVTGMVAIDQ